MGENSTTTKRKPFNNTTEMILRAMQGGAPVKEAVQMITEHPNPHRNTLTRYRNKYKKWSLMHPKTDKIAGETIKAFAEGKMVNGITPKCSTVFAAAKEIKDRTEPIIRADQAGNTYNFTKIDLSIFQGSTPQDIDITPLIMSDNDSEKDK